MTTKTRYFVIISLLVLTVGLGTGLLAYYVGFPTSALTRAGGPDELQFVPNDAALVAFADVHEIMGSDLRQKIRSLMPMKENGQEEFQNQTGINIETDIDRVIFAVTPGIDATTRPGNFLVLASGRFDQVKIEALMREHGATVEQYKDARVILAPEHQGAPISVSFLQPGLAAIGTANLVHGAVDLKAGGSNITTNDDVMRFVRDLDAANAWAVGRFDVLASQTNLPAQVSEKLPAIQWFSASAQIDSGIRGLVRAEARDDEAGNALRDVVRGVMGLVKLQAPSQPVLDSVVRSLQLGGTGKTVTLSFEVPPGVIDTLAAARKAGQPAPTPLNH
ncbi:MAG TPA: hypothetical protein VF456_06670 [Vicinamibacterales bacterium]